MSMTGKDDGRFNVPEDFIGKKNQPTRFLGRYEYR